MAQHTRIAAKYAPALAEPTRVAIVAALDSGPRTATSLARKLGVSEPVIVRHARALETMGLVRQCDDAPRTYELLRVATAWPSTWEELPLPVRRSAAATTLTQLHATAAAALDAGGFDRGDMLLTRTNVAATAERWQAMSRTLHDTLERLDELGKHADAEAADGPREQATAVLMLFTASHSEGSGEHPVPHFGEGEARERTYELVEELDRLMIGLDESHWGRIAAVAEELRLIARAAENLGAASAAAEQSDHPNH